LLFIFLLSAWGLSAELVENAPLLSNQVLAKAGTPLPTKKEKTTDPFPNAKPLIEGKLGYFFFAGSKMRSVYSQGGVDVQLSGTYPIKSWLQLYASAEWFQKSGKSRGAHKSTQIWAVPLSLGLRPVVTICSQVQYYLTVGPRCFFFHAHNFSNFVNKTLNQSGIGGFASTGFYFYPWRHFVIDLFGEYSYMRIKCYASKKNTYTRTVQAGGFTFGAGLGYAF
jgi:hypothetical protein